MPSDRNTDRPGIRDRLKARFRLLNRKRNDPTTPAPTVAPDLAINAVPPPGRTTQVIERRRSDPAIASNMANTMRNLVRNEGIIHDLSNVLRELNQPVVEQGGQVVAAGAVVPMSATNATNEPAEGPPAQNDITSAYIRRTRIVTPPWDELRKLARFVILPPSQTSYSFHEHKVSLTKNGHIYWMDPPEAGSEQPILRIIRQPFYPLDEEEEDTLMCTVPLITFSNSTMDVVEAELKRIRLVKEYYAKMKITAANNKMKEYARWARRDRMARFVALRFWSLSWYAYIKTAISGPYRLQLPAVREAVKAWWWELGSDILDFGMDNPISLTILIGLTSIGGYWAVKNIGKDEIRALFQLTAYGIGKVAGCVWNVGIFLGNCVWKVGVSLENFAVSIKDSAVDLVSSMSTDAKAEVFIEDDTW